jgi:hypothetical protein
MKYIYKRGEKYKVNWKIPGENELIYLGLVDTEEEAKTMLGNAQIEFYSKNSNLLPKAISISSQLNLFQVIINNPIKVWFGRVKTLEEAKELKLKIFKALFD